MSGERPVVAPTARKGESDMQTPWHSAPAVGTRRDFLKTTTGVVLGVGIPVLNPESAPIPRTIVTSQTDPPREVTRLESEVLVLRFYDTGTFAVEMRSINSRWQPDPWEGVACREIMQSPQGRQEVVDFGSPDAVRIRRDGARVTMVFSAAGITVETRLLLDHATVHAEITRVAIPTGIRLVSVEYPFRSFYLRSGIDTSEFTREIVDELSYKAYNARLRPGRPRPTPTRYDRKRRLFPA